MTHLKLVVEYDGTDFCGWQSQTNGRTVQDVLESAIGQVTGETVRVAGAGRTDTGVHAEGQVASFSLRGSVEPALIRRALNGVLPPDVVIRATDAVPEEFHARKSARKRSYRYSILCSRTALRRRTHWSVGWNLNTSYLSACAASVLGENNFRSFAKLGSEVDDWMCTVVESEWSVVGDEFTYRISADRFLYGMVRALVGTMVEIARGHRSPDEFEPLLREGSRSDAGMAAPAHGLCLVSVSYEGGA